MAKLLGETPRGDRSPARRLAVRWRWYHFYFLLAMFDLIVIGASFTLYHRSLKSYSVALAELREIDDAQTWVASIRQVVVQLNAPGNDVFESGRVDEERARFERTRIGYRVLLKQGMELQIDLAEFREQVKEMFHDEESIFDIFGLISGEGLTGGEGRRHLNTATARMASMDRHQADALNSLNVVSQEFTTWQHRLLDRYGGDLEQSATIEKFLFSTVALILIGVFWYGRKLQRTHERMVVEQQWAMEEKHARLAAVGEVCSAVAHGIRNPLSAITSSAQLALEYGTLDEPTKLRIRDVLASTQRLDERITRLLDFSGARPGMLVTCELVQITQDAVREIRSRLEEADIRVEIDYRDQPLVVEGDREWLGQAIIEVVTNAIEHSPSGGSIRIVCCRDGVRPEFARIEITDDGVGIPESIRPRVFDLFFTSKPGGHGIGLASVKRVVEMHGGRVAIASAPSHSTCIEITLPLAQPP